MLALLQALGVMAAAEAQTYKVPCRYSAELAADRRVIAEREAVLDRFEAEIRRLAQERQADAETFRSAVENCKLEYQREVRDQEHTKLPLKAESLYPTMAGRLNATAAFQAPAFLCRKV